MRERPIIFSGPMVRAILEGRKTQTRRVCKDTFTYSLAAGCESAWNVSGGLTLWVRENCRAVELEDGLDGVFYPADEAFIPIDNAQGAAERWMELHTYSGGNGRLVPSIHMPRWASRIVLEVVSVKVERVKDIDILDAIAEGVNTPHAFETSIDEFRKLWNSINAKRGFGWEADPWVWVVEFVRRKG